MDHAFLLAITGYPLTLFSRSMFISTCTLYALLSSALLAVTTTALAGEIHFRPEKFFAGHTRSSGVFRNTIGESEQHFTTDCRGRLHRSTLYLDQRFHYDDGHTQERHWQIRKVDAVHYIGSANDVVGEARGEVSGSRFHFVYIVALNLKNPLLNVQLDQIMTLHRDGTLVNRATIRKFGFPLSRVTEQFRPIGP